MKVPHSSDKWRKSSASGPDTDCVELHPAGAVRDSKNPTGVALAVDLHQMVAAVKAGRINH